MPFPVAETIAATAALAGTAGQIAATGKLNKKNRQWQEDMWNKSNEYNLPINARKRMEAAGMNPALVYGSGGASGGVTTPPQAPKQEVPEYSKFANAAMAWQQAKLQTMQVQQMEKAIEVAESTKKLNEANTVKSISESQMTDTQKDQLVGTYVPRLMGLYADVDVKRNSVDVGNAQIEKMAADVANSTTITAANKEKIGQEIKNMQQTISESMARINQMKIEGNLKGAQTEGQKLQNWILQSQGAMWDKGVNPFAPAKDQVIKRVMESANVQGTIDEVKGVYNKYKDWYDNTRKSNYEKFWK